MEKSEGSDGFRACSSSFFVFLCSCSCFLLLFFFLFVAGDSHFFGSEVCDVFFTNPTKKRVDFVWRRRTCVADADVFYVRGLAPRG